MGAGRFLVRYACRLIEMPYAPYLKALWPAASATAIMALVVLGFRAGVAGHWAPAPRLAAEILLGMAAYAAVVLPAYGSRVRATFKLLREPWTESAMCGIVGIVHFDRNRPGSPG